LITFKDGKWQCSACGTWLPAGIGIPIASKTSTDEGTFVMVSNADGDEIHRCEVRNPLDGERDSR
jgi:hypothetical protein